MFGVRLEPELERRLEKLAGTTRRRKSYQAQEAIRQYVEEREDYLLGFSVLERIEPTIGLEDLERSLERARRGRTRGEGART
jgi:RHH-type transcriptional regulator, rel operon repressor / antitoxin RelB